MVNAISAGKKPKTLFAYFLGDFANLKQRRPTLPIATEELSRNPVPIFRVQLDE